MPDKPFSSAPPRPELDALIKRSKEIVDNMTPKQLAEMVRKQGESWARAEMSWPKAKYHYENGVKVYESYEDYCND